jgi:hypothetical protein
MNAEDVLFVLNGLEPYELSELEFAVITTPASEAWSNHLQRVVPGESWWPFERGEVLVVSKPWGREPWGEGRKPGKWDVGCEYVDTLAEAMVIRNRVLASGGGK